MLRAPCEYQTAESRRSGRKRGEPRPFAPELLLFGGREKWHDRRRVFRLRVYTTPPVQHRIPMLAEASRQFAHRDVWIEARLLKQQVASGEGGFFVRRCG